MSAALLFVLPDWNLFLPSLSHFLSLLVTQYIPWCNNTFLWLSGGRIGRYSINSSRDSLQLPSYIFFHFSTANLNLPFGRIHELFWPIMLYLSPCYSDCSNNSALGINIALARAHELISDSDTARTLIYPSRQASSTLEPRADAILIVMVSLIALGFRSIKYSKRTTV